MTVSKEWSQYFRKNGSSKQLIVVFHAFRAGPKQMEDVCKLAKALFPDGDQYVPQLPCQATSFADPKAISEQQLLIINEIWSDGGAGYASIVFIGHSIGGLIARCVVLLAVEGTANPKDAAAVQWVDKIDRLILLAGMNRGWSAGHHLSLKDQVSWNLGTTVASIIGWVRKKQFLIMTIRRGSPFMTWLRIRWILASNNALSGGLSLPFTIQLLGSVDDMVSPKDNIDLVSGSNFCYLDVPYSGHSSVVELSSGKVVQSLYRPETTVGAERTRVLSDALTSTKEELWGASNLPSDKLQISRNTETDDLARFIHRRQLCRLAGVS